MFSLYYSLAFSWLVAGALALTPLATHTAVASAAKQEAQEAKHKKRIVAWGTNKNVSVKLKSGSKIDGRIADIKDANFSVQLVENGQVVNRDINYSDVDKISGQGATSGGKIAGWIVLGASAAVGTLVLIGLALAD